MHYIWRRYAFAPSAPNDKAERKTPDEPDILAGGETQRGYVESFVRCNEETACFFA